MVCVSHFPQTSVTIETVGVFLLDGGATLTKHRRYDDSFFFAVSFIVSLGHAWQIIGWAALSFISKPFLA